MHRESRVVVELALRDRVSQHRCPYCHAAITVRDDTWVCANCGTIHHQDCYRTHTRCSVHGCAVAAGESRRSPCAPPIEPRRWRRWALAGGIAITGGIAVGALLPPP